MFLAHSTAALAVVSGEEFAFESDELTVLNQQNEAILHGHVLVYNDTGSIRANRIELTYEEEIRQVRHIEAFGDVELDWQQYRGWSDHLTADVPAETATLRGDARVRQAGSNIRARVIHIRQGDGRLRFRDGVEGMYQPPENTADDAESSDDTGEESTEETDE